MKKFILFLFVFMLAALKADAQLFTAEELEVLKLQDERTAGQNNELQTYLNSFNNAVVIRTLIAMGNIGDTKFVIPITEKLLSANNPEIRTAAAFALGLIPCDDSRNGLLEAMKSETEQEVLAQVVKSLGSIGNEDDLAALCGIYPVTGKVSSAYAYSLARFARRNIKNSASVEKIKSLLKTNDAETIRMCAHAFLYTRNRDLLLGAKDELLKLTKSSDADTRSRAFTSFGNTADKTDVNYLMNSYDKEDVWQVKLNIINSFAAIFRNDNSLSSNRELAYFLIDKGEGEDAYLSTAALSGLAYIFGGTTDATLKAEMKPRLQWFLIKGKAVDLASIGEAVKTIGAIYKDEARDELLSLYAQTEGFYLKPYIIQACGYFNDAGVYKDLRKLITADVQNYVNEKKITEGDMIAGKELIPIYRAFVETLDALKGRADDADKETMRLIFIEFAGSKDPSIVDVCINALNQPMYESKKGELKISLCIDYQSLEYPKDKETMKLFIREFATLNAENCVPLLEGNLAIDDYEICRESADALMTITKKAYTFNAKRKSFFDADKLNELYKKQTAIIHTSRGDIVLKLFPYNSPLTVLNFVSLAEKGFFNNTMFHRVVPGFVIQGGDPLNNGWGGPEYSIRSEFIPMSFERGVLGMASEGKDTEGSQFFIMHAPFYHLDNLYTIFGEVTSGMDVVDKIYTDDFVKSVNILMQ